jgi:hypothetical protein
MSSPLKRAGSNRYAHIARRSRSDAGRVSHNRSPELRAAKRFELLDWHVQRVREEREGELVSGVGGCQHLELGERVWLHYRWPGGLVENELLDAMGLLRGGEQRLLISSSKT